MKLITAFLTILLFNLTSEFDEGFKDGYIEGYCYEIEYCTEPIPPEPPIPDINRETYKDGYNKGFVKGKEDR